MRLEARLLRKSLGFAFDGPIIYAHDILDSGRFPPWPTTYTHVHPSALHAEPGDCILFGEAHMVRLLNMCGGAHPERLRFERHAMANLDGDLRERLDWIAAHEVWMVREQDPQRLVRIYAE